MILIFLLNIKFQHLKTIKLSSKTAKITLSSSKNLLAIAEVSDSLNAFPPRFRIFNIGDIIYNIQEIPGSCSSFGKSIASFNNGFYVSSPHSAFKWGNPGPLLTKIIPPYFNETKLDTPLIPYGETLATNEKGNIIILCSPFSTDNCIILNNGTLKLKSPSGLTLFGLSIAISPNGNFIAILSKGTEGYIDLHFYNNNLEILTSFLIPHLKNINLKENSPFLNFKDDKHLILVIYSIQKILIYKNTINGWLPEQPIEILFNSFSFFNNFYLTLTKDGILQLLDNNFIKKFEEIIPKNIINSKFINIIGGFKWFAVLEESDLERSIHIYKNIQSNIIKLLYIFIYIILFFIFYFLIKFKFDFLKILKLKNNNNRAKQV